MLVLGRPSAPNGPVGKSGGPEGSPICSHQLTSSHRSFLKKKDKIGCCFIHILDRASCPPSLHCVFLSTMRSCSPSSPSCLSLHSAFRLPYPPERPAMAFSTGSAVTFSAGTASSTPPRRCCRTAWCVAALSHPPRCGATTPPPTSDAGALPPARRRVSILASSKEMLRAEHMLQVYVSSVSDVSNVCCKCFIRMLQK
jgi:hypothetical protein